MDELDRALALARAPGLHVDHLRAAAAADDPLRLPGTGVAALVARGLPAAAAAWLSAPDLQLLAADRHWLRASGGTLILCNGEHYPPLLAEIATAPVALYLHGDTGVLASLQLAVVGSRSPTVSGRRTARDFAQHLARAGLTITSGLAVGIDAAAHEGALAAPGRTIAILGCGLDQIYPPEHTSLARALIAQGGALVSEFPPGTPPRRENFPRRNRLISGLSLGTLVVEAARYSGSLITAKQATSQGREVFAIPGSIHNPLSRGCHELIRNGAKLVETSADVLSELKIPYEKQSLAEGSVASTKTALKPPGLDKDYEILLDALGFEPASIDALVERTGLPSSNLASMLLILELEGRIGLHAGGRFARVK